MIARRDPWAGSPFARPPAGPAALPVPDGPTGPPTPGAVLVVPDLADARPTGTDRAALAAARALAKRHGTPVLAACFGAVDAAALGAEGVAEWGMLPVETPPLARTGVVAALAVDLGARAVVLPDTPRRGGPLGRAVAAVLGVMPNTRVVALTGDDALGLAVEPGHETVAPLARVVLVAASFRGQSAASRGAARPVALTIGRIDPPATLVDRGPATTGAQAAALEEAAVVLCAGAGVADVALAAKAARALGAALGASRAVTDAGRLPRDLQIGASGRSITARVYLGFGVSGAIQHLEGITRCRAIVAVNTDPACALAAQADLTVAADADAVLRALVAMKEAGKT